MNDKVVVPKKKRSINGLFVSLALLSLVSLFTAGYFFYQYDKLVKNPVSTQASAEDEAKKLMLVVGKLMLLPKDESPSVATITDISKLADQQFFKNAVNGDKVLIFANSKLAIVYNPTANLIVNAGPVNLPEPTVNPTPKK